MLEPLEPAALRAIDNAPEASKVAIHAGVDDVRLDPPLFRGVQCDVRAGCDEGLLPSLLRRGELPIRALASSLRHVAAGPALHW